jgi:endonuclease/exonuclease/phosphatase family metal-dependent hydrolase
MILVLGAVVLGLVLVFGLTGERERTQQAASTSSDTFTVVELNACWLFDGIGEEQFSTAPQCIEDAEEKVTNVANYLSTTSADIIVIEEIESAEMLHRLNEKLGNVYQEIFVQGTDDYTGQDVAALSRFPVLDMGRTDATQRYPVPGSSYRAPMGAEGVDKHFWATLDIDGEPVTIIGVHFLAYPDDLMRVVPREAQALIVHNLAADFLAQGNDVIILGDINDFDSEVIDAAGDQPRSIVDQLLRDIDPDTEGDELQNVAAWIPQAERYTYWYDEDHDGIDDTPEEHSMIDHMYVSQDLAARIVAVRIDHGAYEARTVSDHWPLVATFELP